jgi:hypothetical protein
MILRKRVALLQYAGMPRYSPRFPHSKLLEMLQNAERARRSVVHAFSHTLELKRSKGQDTKRIKFTGEVAVEPASIATVC